MDFNALALECAPMVAPQTLAAIVKTESNFNSLAININKGCQMNSGMHWLHSNSAG